jgi:thiamine biosynthesis lipoprotein
MIDKKRAAARVLLTFFFSLLILAGFALRFWDAKEANLNTRSRESLAMDTIIKISVSSAKTPEDLELILNGAFGIISDLDGKFSMHIQSSDISLVNANAGIKPVRVSSETADVVRTSLAVAELTDGAFDPTIGPISALWRIQDGTNPRRRLPDDTEISDTLSLVGKEMAKASEDGWIYLEKPGMKLDLGGIAKGYVSAAVGNFLISAGVKSALIDLGGNVVAVGNRPNGGPWRIGIQHPYRPRGEPVCSITVSGTSVITAGVYERYIEIGGKKYTHIFDPRTGRPVEGDLLSVTIVAEDPTVGDALSTAFMTMGIEKSKKLLESVPGIEAIFVTKGEGDAVELTTTGGIKGLIRMESPRAAQG